jgi:hypothetical protein|tara:strand:+ start:7119 stop:7526 length:408 start_codon:yes stop_codon:yes gene_type:complete
MPKVTLTKEANDRPKRELLPPGDYEVEIIDHEFGVTQKGDDKLTLTLSEPDTGNYVWCHLMFTPKTEWKVKSLLRALGISKEGTEVDVNEELCNNMKGTKVWANISIEEYNGTRNNRISRFLNEKPSSGEDEEFK